MKVLCLHTRLSGYFLASLEAASHLEGYDFNVVSYPASKDAPFTSPSETTGIVFKNASGLSQSQLSEHANAYEPDAVLLAGWWNKDYLVIASQLKKRGIPVIMTMDNQWTGKIKQRLRAFQVRAKVRQAATHLWIPGQPQMPLATHLGFSSREILTGYYSCDDRIFRSDSNAVISRDFIYVGRLASEKNISGLVEGYRRYQSRCPEPWRLTCVGVGPLESAIQNVNGIEHLQFVQPFELPALLSTAKAFVIASQFEPWGVAIHEAAATGLPLVCSRQCGAATHLLQHGVNGMTFDARDPGQLADCLEFVSNLPEWRIRQWGDKSELLAKTFSIDGWVQTLRSVVGHSAGTCSGKQ